MSNRNRTQLIDYNCFFITATCFNHYPLLTIGDNMMTLCENITIYNEQYAVGTLGYVLMPNHFHSIILFKNHNFLSDYMRDLKKYTSVKIRNEILIKQPLLLPKLEYRTRKQFHKIWGDRFNDKVIYNTKFLQQKLDYIHNNPLQDHWRLAKTPEEYRYSSARFYLTGIQGDIHVSDYRNYFSIQQAS